MRQGTTIRLPVERLVSVTWTSPWASSNIPSVTGTSRRMPAGRHLLDRVATAREREQRLDGTTRAFLALAVVIETVTGA